MQLVFIIELFKTNFVITHATSYHSLTRETRASPLPHPWTCKLWIQLDAIKIVIIYRPTIFTKLAIFILSVSTAQRINRWLAKTMLSSDQTKWLWKDTEKQKLIIN